MYAYVSLLFLMQLIFDEELDLEYYFLVIVEEKTYAYAPPGT